MLARKNEDKYNSDHISNKLTKSSKFRSTNGSTFFNTTSNFLNLNKINKSYKFSGT